VGFDNDENTEIDYIVFTGLIQGQGQLRGLGPDRLQILTSAEPVLAGLAIGDSVAVDGVCLTVETLDATGFSVAISPETIRRSTLQHQIDSDWWVNLEPALRVGDRLGGHFVSGHVDGVGVLKAVQQTAQSWELTFQVSGAIAVLVVAKGSIAINGISLTIAECDQTGAEFRVAVIPHSFAMTNLQALQPGMAVNLETDLLGKYVAKLLEQGSLAALEPATIAPVSLTFLQEHGYGDWS
jgi:riboflavin synthase